jgi:hypothetical protein
MKCKGHSYHKFAYTHLILISGIAAYVRPTARSNGREARGGGGDAEETAEVRH